MSSLNNNQKEWLFKGAIIFGILMIIGTLIFVTLSESVIQGSSAYKLYCGGFISCLLIAAIDCGFIYYLMDKVKLSAKKVSSERLILDTNKYEEFEKTFMEELYQNGYGEYKEIPNKLNCLIKYCIHKSMSINDLVLIVRSKDTELNDDVYQNYFEYSLNYIIEQEPYLANKNTNLIHIICVDRVNDNLKKITESNVEQGYGRFHLPVGISFGSRTVYIATQKDGFFIARYKKLVKMFKKYVESQIEK